MSLRNEPEAGPSTVAPGPSTVLYVGGSGRSGSTLLGRVLGQRDGWVCVGELVFLWTRGLQDDELCGCGQSFSRCPFWVAVGEHAFGGWDKVDARATAQLQATVDRHRYLPLMLVPAGTGYGQRLREYGQLLSTVYRAIREVSGAEVVVDTSKHPSYAYVLRRVPGVRLRLVHLVRDSRGVCYSWTRSVRRPEVVDGQALMPRYAPLRSATEWMLHNLLFEVLGALGVRHQVVRYEDFVSSPSTIVAEVARTLIGSGKPEEAGAAGVEGVHLRSDHSLAGNPMRFREGYVALKVDDEWRRAMPGRARRAVTAATALGLVRYGYLSGRADTGGR